MNSTGSCKGDSYIAGQKKLLKHAAKDVRHKAMTIHVYGMGVHTYI